MIKKVITHPYTALIGRIVLGAVFLYASVSKILHPEQFAQALMNYRILPLVSVNLVAVILPWVELVVGVLLLVGLFTRASSVVAALLLALFLGAVGSALVRGLDISCGCFPSNGMGTINLLYLARDLVLLALALHVFSRDRQLFSLGRFLNRSA